MLNNLTIRQGLTLVICVFAALLLTVIGVGWGALKFSNDGLQNVQQTSAAMSALASSSEKLLQVRLSLGSYETLFSVGKETDGLLAAAHKMLEASNDEFRVYMAGPFGSDQERKLAQTVADARMALVNQAIEPEHKALVDNDFNTFRTIQGETGDHYYGIYAKAIDALRHAHADNRQRQAEQLSQRFRISTGIFIAIGVVAIVVGALARAGLSAAVVKPVNQTIRHFRSMAEGDLTSTVKVRSRNEMGQLLQALAQMRDGLVETVSKVRGSTQSITLGANEIAAGNADLSSRTEQQAAALQQTAASMEELSATVKQNTDNAKLANLLAQGALETVVRGSDVVTRVTETMDGITGSSRKVGEIIGIIEGIAFQTNILALNAAVEAARAGEQGRGFAVVASEVRALAQRSAAAAKEIRDLIGDSTAQVEQGASLVADARKTMQEAMASVERVTGIMTEIESAAHEQSDGIEQINKAIGQIDEVTQQNAALVQQAAAAAKSLEAQAIVLREAVAVFRVEAAAGVA
ncbi:HAMP domain-containing protein [Paraburkholderia sp. CNPSo 3157]|uniref:HAMP domain-containing protein n=1 Tax=Paraburkholderia franconis TaxID=2654983 RepID=A0A7X1NEP8_9BURK|nr:methyl-accepting chemotaxis protein [Paraburkholderia franconis]MPW20582.1 HAMP domain-containing protein [Paraburkholderia franconis]